MLHQTGLRRPQLRSPLLEPAPSSPKQWGWPVLSHRGHKGLPQLPSARQSQLCPQSLQPAPSCCAEQVRPSQKPLRSRAVAPWSRTTAICSDFSFHPENPSVSPSPQESCGLRPPPCRPEGRGVLFYPLHRLGGPARGVRGPQRHPSLKEVQNRKLIKGSARALGFIAQMHVCAHACKYGNARTHTPK